MTASRRTGWNFALQRAVAWAIELARPLVVLEAVRVDHPWANDRLHQFLIDGMAEHAATFANNAATYLPFIEPTPGDGKGLLATLAARSAVVVTDDYPCFFVPAMVAAAIPQVTARFEQVDGNGLLPMRSAGRAFNTAYLFRRHLQASVLRDGLVLPTADPLADVTLPRAAVDEATLRRWPMATQGSLSSTSETIARLPIDHAVRPAPLRGGTTAARRRLATFVSTALDRYGDEQAQPEADATSGLSPYLHFGHMSSHEVFDAVLRARHPDGGSRPTPRTPAPGVAVTGQRHGFWGLGASAESFLDQLVVWRELAFNTCVFVPDYASFGSLPGWAQTTLERHASDPRPVVYDIDALEHARTHDPLWNAIQTQLTRDGWFHNYLRMLWGKRILEWSAHPRDALTTMATLMNRYALDGRDPNAYAGYAWTLGRYDRPWAPERQIFGRVRYMSSANTLRKLRLKRFLSVYGPPTSNSLF
ncbi:MAG: hypothetical protein U0Q12_19200 [Vicinamibacterales bacterium]